MGAVSSDSGAAGPSTGVRARLLSPSTLRLLTAQPVVATPAAMARFGCAFYVSGGLIAMSVALFGRPNPRSGWLLALGLIAVLGGVLYARLPGRVPRSARVAMNFVGTAMVLAVVLLAGRGDYGRALFWLFCYVPVDSFFFFPWVWAVPMLAWGMAATAVAAFGAHVMAGADWAVTLVVAVNVSFAMGWLVRRAAQAEWDPVADMLNRLGLERLMADWCVAAERGGPGFGVAAIGLDDPPAVPGRDEAAARTRAMHELLRAWRGLPAEPARWARVREYDFAVAWRGPGFDEYLEQVRQAAEAIQPVSIGVADWRPGERMVHLQNEALSGRRHSERGGGNRVTRSGPTAGRVEELRRALAAEEITVLFQPLVSLCDGTIVGAEALARWAHTRRGLLGPNEFVPLAEHAGLVHELGERMLHLACREAASWPVHAGNAATVAVNVSAHQLERIGFVEVVTRALEAYRLDPARLVLEVTESTMAASDATAIEVLARLSAHGIAIAIDDFGTAYSNLARLAAVPVDILKVDRSLMANVHHSERRRALLRGLIAMAAGLDVTTVIEGLETAEDVTTARDLGADEGQGWYFGAPMPGADFARLREATAAHQIVRRG